MIRTLASLLLFLPMFAAADSPKDLARSLKGKILLLRGQYIESNVTFDSQGNVTGEATPGPFSVSAVRVSKVHLSSGALELEGHRGTLIYIGRSEPIQTSQIEIITSANPVHIVISLDSAHPETLGVLLTKIFAVSVDDALANKTEEQRAANLFTVASLAPATHLRSFPASHDPTSSNSGAAQTGSDVTGKNMPLLEPEGGVIPPQLLHSVDPEFTDEARKNKISGICVVSVIVDPSGFPIHIRIAKPLPAGLDQNAVAAVSQYRFEPAIFQGHPVAVAVSIEVNYRIYSR